MKLRISYLLAVLITLLVALGGSWVTSYGMSWYETLKLPAWTPSGQIIGLAWTIIFILTAWSAILVLKLGRRHPNFWLAIVFFLINAVLNFGWSALFFGWHKIAYSFAEMIILLCNVLALITCTWPISRKASLLLVPYAAWVIFATYLFWNVLLLNP